MQLEKKLGGEFPKILVRFKTFISKELLRNLFCLLCCCDKQQCQKQLGEEFQEVQYSWGRIF